LDLQANERLTSKAKQGGHTFETLRSTSKYKGIMCGICGKDLFPSGWLVRVDDKDVYHLDCFCCTQCKCTFDKYYWKYQGRPYCFKHYCIAQNLWCSACNNLIDTEEIIHAVGDKVWHPNCFVCATCRRPFGATNYWEHNGKPYCAEHFSSAAGIICAKCNRPIEPHETEVQAVGKNWHESCFTCMTCQLSLTRNPFYDVGGFPYCKDHQANAKRNTSGFRPPSSTVTSTPIYSEPPRTSYPNKFEESSRSQEVTLSSELYRAPPPPSSVNLGYQPSQFSETHHSSPSLNTTNLSGDRWCSGCGTSLGNDGVKVDDKYYHRNCFVCTSCRTPFRREYGEKDGRPYCLDCLNRLGY